MLLATRDLQCGVQRACAPDDLLYSLKGDSLESWVLEGDCVCANRQFRNLVVAFRIGSCFAAQIGIGLDSCNVRSTKQPAGGIGGGSGQRAVAYLRYANSGHTHNQAAQDDGAKAAKGTRSTDEETC